MNNIINFEQERNRREQGPRPEAPEVRRSQTDTPLKKEYAIRETHVENGNRAVELLDGQLVRFDYVDTRAIIASHEAVNKDREMRGAKEVMDFITDDAHREAHGHAAEHIDETAKQAVDLLSDQESEPEPNDVFGRTFRKFTIDHGSTSLLRLRTIPNWSCAERNQGELTRSLKSGLAFALPRELAADMVAALEYQSAFGLANSNERTKGTFVTGKARGGDKP